MLNELINGFHQNFIPEALKVTKDILNQDEYKDKAEDIQKQVIIQVLCATYDKLDEQFKFPDEQDKFVKETVIPNGVSFVYSLLKVKG